MNRTNSQNRPVSAAPTQSSKLRPSSVNKKSNLPPASGSLNNLNPTNFDPFASISTKSINPQYASAEQTSKNKSVRIKKAPRPSSERKPFEEINVPPTQASQFPGLNLTSPTYRFVQPTSQKVDISQKLWMDAVEKSTGLMPNPLISPAGSLSRPKSGLNTTGNRFARPETRGEEDQSQGGEYPDQYKLTYGNENFTSDEGRGLGSSKPFAFLSNVGGRSTNLSEIVGEAPINKRPQTGITQSRKPVKEATGQAEDISLFVNSNVDKTEKTKEKKAKPQRPQTVNIATLMQRNDSAGTMKSTKQIIIRAQKPPSAAMTTVGDEASKRPMTATDNIMRKSQSANIRISTAKGRLMSSNIHSAHRKGTGGPELVDPAELQDEFDDLGIKEDLEDDDEVYRKMDTAKNLKKTNQSRMFSSSRPISGIRAGPEEFFANFAKFTNFAELENVYEELFDRNERTFAATFAKFGDLGYYSPLQRIGSYMQFSAKLKKEHLDEIIDFLRTVTSVEKPEYEIPIQLAIIDELDPYQNRQKTGISTTFHLEDMIREPLTLSLYPEYIELTDMPKDADELRENTASQMAAHRYFEKLLDLMNGNYDPEYLGRNNFLYISPEEWPKKIQDQVILSYKRYKHYIHSDEIKHHEISKYKKEWITNALSLVPEVLLKTYEESVRRMFQEIFENYKVAMKEAIVDYILRNPDERKRLNITLLLQHIPCSAERIAREGGFSIKLYPAWHESVAIGKEDTKNNSHQLGVVTSAILDWYQDFAELELFEHTAIKDSAAKGFTLDIPSFKKLQDSYRYRTISLLRNVFYRGVVLILKKCKHLRRKQHLQGQWDYNGFKTRGEIMATKSDYNTYEDQGTDQSNLSYRNFDAANKAPETEQFYNDLLYQKLDLECNFRERFDYLDDIQQLEELLDIRETPAYRVYSVLTDNNLQLQENLYKLQTKEERKSLRASVSVQVSLLLRKLVEKGVKQFAEFFCSVPTLEEAADDLSYMKPGLSRVSLDVEEEKDEKSAKIKVPIGPGQLRLAGTVTGGTQGEVKSKPVIGTKAEISGRRPPLMSVVNLEKMDLQKPEFMFYQAAMFPILRIDMIFEEGALKFKETEDYIKSEVGSLYKGIVEALDGLLHPEYTKIEVKNQIQGVQDEKKDETALSNTLQNADQGRRLPSGEEIAYSQNAEEIYSRFCDIVVLKEKPPKKKVVAFGFKEEVEPENLVPKHLKIADLDEDFFIDIFEETVDHLLSHYIEAQQSFQIFAQFKPFFTKAIDKEIKALFAKKNFVLEEYRNYLIVLKNFEDLLHQIPNSVYFPLFEVNCELVKHHLENSIEDLKNKIFNRLESNIIEQFRSISEKYNSNVAYIRRDTDSPEEVELMEKFIYDLNFDRTNLKNRANEAFRGLMALFKLEHMGSDLLQNLAKEIHEWPSNMDKELKSAEDKHNAQRVKLEEKLRDRRTKFENTVDIYEEDLEKYTNFTEYTSYKRNIEEITEFNELLNQAERDMEEIQDHEKKLFGIVSTYEKFVGLKKSLEPYVDFWNTVGDFLEAKRAWMHGPFKQVNPLEVETIVKGHVKTSNKLGKMFDKNPIAGRLASEFKEDVQSVSEMLPIIEVICNPGLKERHWNQIEELTGAKFNPEEGSLKEILAKGVNSHLATIEELSEQASKEFKLESMLDKMEKDWENLRFVVSVWKNTNVSILQGAALEDIMLVLDDHTLKAQTIRSNPNIKFMEERAVRWEKLMLYIQEVLDVWIKVQSSYLYLEPIFGSEDIIGQMPKEAKKFSEVDNVWKDIMVYVERDPLVLNIERIPRLLEKLNTSLLQIEEIQKGLNLLRTEYINIDNLQISTFGLGLEFPFSDFKENKTKTLSSRIFLKAQGVNDYLERKRLDFPRFFFLSNEDLLNILAETKDPLLVQPHLKKCFEGINELIFSSGVEILGMRSSEGEEINFLEKISPKNYKSNVEQWLGKVEEQMRESLQKVTEDSLNDLTKTRIPRTEWVVKWPGQVVICISQTLWTFVVEDRLRTSGLVGIKEYNNELRRQLEDIVALVRGNLTNQERITLGALIVIEVHARDVVSDLVQDQVTDIDAFEWISQMRYYWEASEKRINVKMITSSMDYGYEYLGNTGRLVITPLTDRCYRTLMSALQLNLGGAPEGPAGTGKTETTKDLAKALAMQCVVFNCSDGLNSHAMAKFFKGLASSGAWSCFDEFNRIELEVLSVVAQQILEIQVAKNLGKRHFSFAGTQTLELRPTCNVFITMNPGYAGRSELPDNLKALFRPVAMMVPDYSMIAEISLYSYGFDQARDLARKIVATYKLCSEQLSSQDHYDYGMRAVKAVLTTAGQLKRKFLTEKEDTLMLRSICDVNLPKFLTQDIQLFMGIISDLFPGVKAPQVEYGVLNDTITAAMQKYKLQNVPNFRKKIFQLYEMVNCRHGLMLVGQPFSGKTMCYRVLAKALTDAAASGESEENATYYHVINPKSLTIAQLYGYSDPISKEWTEGVLAEIFRKCATNTSPDRQWIVFDGPVDADWIENMNTVLDDNKKLCLMNGETIAMSNPMTMMFEVADLLQASPATVSRCGMIYMQPDNIGWWPLVLSWTAQFEHIYEIAFLKHLEDLFDAIFGKCVEFIKGKCFEYQAAPEGNLAVSTMRLMYAFMNEYDMVSIEGISRLKPEDVIARMDMIFLYSIIWSVGATTTEAGRKLFGTFFKKLIGDTIKCDNHKDRLLKLDKTAILPEGSGSIIQDYYLEDFKWKNWKERLDKYELNLSPEMRYHDIVVPTTESLRITSFLKLSLAYEFPFLLIGPTGTGKSLFIGNHLKTLSLETNLIIFVTFSAQTTATQTQEIIDEKMEKIRKGIYGPGFGKKCLIFIDDLNMPAFDKYGAQPPIELVRQFFDHKGWYDRKDRKFREIIETNILSAMGPPGGGRNVITPRLLRHFYIYATTESDDKTFTRIFSKIIDWHLSKQGLDQEVGKVLRFAIEGSIEVYTQVCENLKPTPAKSHYLFNLRDLSRVVQGMLLLGKNQANDNKKLVRLWMHEICRVFYDRLTTEADQAWFFDLLVHTTKNKLRENDIKVLFKPLIQDDNKMALTINSHEVLKYLRFGDVMSDELNVHERPYDEIKDQVALQKRIEKFLEEYNEMTKKPMTLVMFEYAIDHILRICRLLKMARSHALLVGLGGSGRQSLTRVAAFICEHEVFTVEVSKSYTFDQWRGDIKRLLISAGAELKYFVFLLTDRHIVGDYVLEDLNNLLNSGDVPNAIPQEEFLPLIDKLRIQAKQEGKEDLYNSGTNTQFYDYFIENVKAHLHIVLVQSSIGDSLRTRMRMFPSIVNCCTCIWYKRWPTEALHAVAQKFVSDLGLESRTQRGMVESVKFMHESVKNLSDDYLKVEGRYNYITPTSYLELLSSLKNLLANQRKRLSTRLESYEKGVQKLIETAEEVKKMEKELTDKRPVLLQMKEENAKLSATIEASIIEMEPKRIQVEEEEAYVNSRVQEAEVIRKDCQNELSQALPLVEKAKKALQNIDPNDIINLKSMLKPPVTVQLVLEAVCVLLKEAPVKMANPEKPGEKIDSYWEKSKKLLGDYKQFMGRLLSYDIDKIDEALMEKVREKYLSRTSEFNPARVEKASSAAKGLCEWVIALSKYEKVLAIVRPKQKEYDRACEEVETLRKSLKEKTDELNILNAQIKDLQDKYEETRQKQAELEEDINMCQKKLDRAQILTGSLGGERDRWSLAVTEYQDKLRYFVGDVLLSAGTISYLGPFSSMYRARIQKEWIDMVKKNDIQVSGNYSLEQSLGEPILIRKWIINGLPSDSFSRENGIIIDNAGRYSLMIDPQNQANKWIKNNEMDNELRVVKQSDNDFLKTLENAVSFGWVLLIENVHEELDAILEPILMKQTFKNAGVLSIRIGENIVDYNKSFRLFMTTKLRNPHYAPEVSIKITLVNFMITKEGLDDQLLEIAVAKENPDLEEQRSKLIVQSHENQQQLEEIETKILNILRTSQGNILNDEEAINVLAQSKVISKDIEEKQKAAEVTEKKIEEARTGYKPIAVHSRVLFFALMSLCNIEVVYQYSLTWFIQLFLNAFNQAERSQFLLQRVNNVIDTLTYSVYTNVCRSVFEKDKLLFSFVLTHAILESKGKINPREYAFLISPAASSMTGNIPANPLSWLSNPSWIRIHELSKVSEFFKDLPQSLQQESNQWKQISDDPEAHKKTFPAPFQTISHMQRLCILKVLKPDRVISAIREFITSEMGAKFITPPPFDLNKSFSESVASQPLIFILPGTDPMNLLLSFAEHHGKANTLQKISLGQGQGPIAERAIKEARESAGWVILQNCHLAPSWMPELEKICENLESKAGKEKTHPSFRLWLTTYPSKDFPVSILQSSVKMTNEPPKGLKNNMMVSYMSDPISHIAEFYETNTKPKVFKDLLFGLCMFHAVIQERRNYGALGWNIHYDFNQSDLRISVKQLHLFLDQYKGTPFKALHYLTGECNYGGRVTDDRDRRILKALMLDFYDNKVLQQKNYAFAGISTFSLPETGSHENVLKYLENMPAVAPPELFGFHSNAEISKDLKETNEMCYNLLLIGGGNQSSSAKEGDSDEAKLKKICDDILGKIPKEFNPEIVKAKYPVSYNNSMNTVLGQEIIRYNRLTSTITSSLKNIDQALKGLQVMSEQLEKVTQSLLRGLVPDMWKKRSYPSLKPLASYIQDLIQRLTYFQKWIDQGYPNVYWISGFFFTQSFLTGVLQNYARKNTIPIDNLTFDFNFQDEPTNPETLNERYEVPVEGCYIYGLFLEGARWDYINKRLEESHIKVLYSQAPIIWLKPISQADVRDYPHYKCPVYKTTERKGTLSTTGHSTNFIMTVNMDSEHDESHWVKRGVAMICQLSD